MADKNNEKETHHDEELIAKAKNFWDKNGKIITIAGLVVILAFGGWYIYQNYFKKPKEVKATDAIFKAEEYYLSLIHILQCFSNRIFTHLPKLEKV